MRTALIIEPLATVGDAAMLPESSATDPDNDARPRRPHSWSYAEMLTSALLGLVAAVVLSIEAYQVARNPHLVASCDLSARISCTAVANAPQAKLFGFPNSYLGLIAEPVVITLAVAALGGVRFPRWFMLAAQMLATAGLVFALWLFTQAYFVIHALCPWCLLVTVTTTLVWSSMLRVNILDGALGARVAHRCARPLGLRVDTALVVVFLTVLAAMVIIGYL